MNEEPLTFDEFIEACDEQSDLISRLSEFMNQHAKVSEQGSKKNIPKKATGEISIRELYSTLVVGAGISPAYVLDQMQWYEIDSVLDGYDLKQRDGWKKVRAVAVASLQSNSTKRLKAQKVFPLPWDKQGHKQAATVVEKPSDDYIHQMREEALQFIQSEKEVVNLNKLNIYGR
ncbi:MAG: hypothetical protein LUG96_11045 [Tannerellaceae bacterium]|nr:hypothetical protein [Tannerellaceae bacterium]